MNTFTSKFYTTFFKIFVSFLVIVSFSSLKSYGQASSLTVSGAGTAAANGTYTLSGGGTPSALYTHSSGSYFIYWLGGPTWNFSSTNGGAPDYTAAGSVTSNLSSLTWVKVFGSNPAPSITSTGGTCTAPTAPTLSA
ncbi:MAG: hypothetical protein ACPGYY_11185, partial [Bacteroidia bacterium]